MNKNILWALFFIFSCCSYLYAKRMVTKQQTIPIDVLKDKHWLNDHGWFKIIPLAEILNQNPRVIYKQLTDKYFFDFPEFPLSSKFPHRGYFNELFILKIPNGRVQGMCGHVFIEGKLSEEMARGDRFDCLFNVPKIKENNVKEITGRVAVIAQHGAGGKWANYYHALYEVFGRLAMLEMFDIQYDWLYIPLDAKYVKELLQLWGIDFSKIIAPDSENYCLQADELIVPSMVINKDSGHKHAGNYLHPDIINYLKNKFLSHVSDTIFNKHFFSDKIFISRKGSVRCITNENDLFEKLKPMGFVSYELANMSIIEQIILFAQAKIVVGEHGAGFTNILFCKSGTKIIEVFQGLIDPSFWYLCNVFNFDYQPILTIPVDVDYFANWREQSFMTYMKSATHKAEITLDKIEKIVTTVRNIL